MALWSAHCFVPGVLTVVISLLLLFYDVRIPNMLKGVIFYAQVSKKKSTYCEVHVNGTQNYVLSVSQVIGLIYRNTPNLVNVNASEWVSIFCFFLKPLYT